MTFSPTEIAVRGELLTQTPLADYTSWRCGGKGDYVFLPADLEDLSYFLHQVPADYPRTYLGLGSNTLVRDAGIDGIVIITQGYLNQLTQIDATTVRAEAGIASAQLARYSARLGGAGLEFLAGIPGTVGGALAMNAGCFGGETWQFVQSVETIDLNGVIRKRDASEFEIAYREVKKPAGESFVAGYFSFQPGEKQASLEKIRQLLERRSTTQPTGTANCGSVFRNPPNDYAGRLIESCGLKGFAMGGASVSEKHANFILNEHHASATEIETLIATVQQRVFEQTGVMLKQEVHVIGRKC